MKKKSYYNYDYNYFDNNYRNILMDRISVNKKPNIINKIINPYNYRRINTNNSKDKDNLNYEKDLNIFKNRIQNIINKNRRNKLSEEKRNINLNKNNYYNKEIYKKTINTYSNENRYQDRNIFEELENNKYLRPMLITSNINTKLLKCNMEDPIKNMYSLSLRNYFSNIKSPFQKNISRQKYYKEIYEDKDNINSYKLNNKTVLNKFSININNEYSPSNDYILYKNKNNSNSFINIEDSQYCDNCLLRNSINNNKNNSNQIRRNKKENDFYIEKMNEKNNILINKKSRKIYQKNIIAVRSPFNMVNNDIYNNSKILNNTYINSNNDIQRDKILLQIYKNKLLEEFIIVLNKFILNYIKKNSKIFFKNLVNFKNRCKIYFKKKNSRINIKNLSINVKNDEIKLTEGKKISKNISEKTTNYFNKSYSKEYKSSSTASNFRTNNYKIYTKQNSSFVLTDHKLKKDFQSPNDSLDKNQKITIFHKKVILPQKGDTGSYHKNIYKSPSQFETKENFWENFIYKKKNLNNDILYINKNNKNNEIIELKLDSNKYNRYNKDNKIINNNKKGKIIDIDINLGKPINIINDYTPIQEITIENNPKEFNLNTSSNKSINISIKGKKNKSKSGPKNKIKPPLRIKKFMEEDEIQFDNNIIDYGSGSSINREDKAIDDLNNKIKDINIELNESNKMKEKLFIRFNYLTFYNNKHTIQKGQTFDNLIMENNTCIMLKQNDIKNNYNISIHSDLKNEKNIVNKLYINCTKFLVKIFNKIIKKKIFMELVKYTEKI